MAEQDFITGPFGSAVPTARPVVPEPGIDVGATPLADEVRVPFTDAALAGERGVAESRAAREARANLADSGVWEGIGAGMTTWDTTRLIKRLARPAFDDEAEPFNKFEYLENLPEHFSEDEHEYFSEVAKGTKSAEYALQVIRDQREAREVAGSHPVAGTAIMFLDPVWLAIPPALRAGRLAPAAGRAVSAVTAGAVGGGMVAAGEGPTSDMEIALAMVMNSAAGAVFYRPGKGLVRADPDFPTNDVLSITESLNAAQPAKPRMRMARQEEWEDVEVPGAPDPKFLHDFSLVFNEQAITKAREGYVVMMTPDEFRTLAFPRERTTADLTADQATALAEGKRGPIRAAITKGGLDGVPSLRIEGGKVTGHDGRHRADVLEENGFDEIPVLIKGERPAAGAAVVSETGESTVRIRERVQPNAPGVVERRKVREAVWEEVPAELHPNAVRSDPAKVAAAVDTVLTRSAKQRGIGERLMWNTHKTMSNFGTAGKRIADFLYDNNSDLSRHSVESQREAVLHDLRRGQVEYEDLLRAEMAANGAGTLKMLNPFTSREAYATQAKIEQAVQRELFRREQAARTGVAATDDVPANIKMMADKLDAMHKRALAEMKAAGVEGAENLLERPGYLNRKWNSVMIDSVIDRFEKRGLTREQAHAKVVDLVAVSLRRASGAMDDKLAKQIGGAIVDRAQRRGYFEDSLFNAPAGEGTLKELRDILSPMMDSADVERALNVLRVVDDEAGKAGILKHRMDLDYDATVRVGNETVSIMDLIDSRVSTIVDQYNQRVATQVAFARRGMKKRSDVEKLREELLHDTPIEKRAEAQELFDNTIAHYRGEPSGQRMNERMRLFSAYGRSISLAWSGLWQMTEYATAMGEYGLVKSLKYATQEFPGFKQLMKPDAATAKSLETVLADHSVQSLRLRPFLARYEDGYEMGTSSALQLSAQTIGQAVPMANAMKYVHHHQARMVGNLILDRVRQAADGNIKAREALAKYGLEAPVMDKLAAEIKAKGFDVDAWDHAVWAEVRPTFAKMMDAAVLKGRLGDVPAFAAFDNVGKFIFTYRTFVLTAHNKILAGGLERNGASAVGLVLLYQLPLSMAAVQAHSVVMGAGIMEPGDMAQKAVGQMGGLGLFSEPFKWVTGQDNKLGAPGLIPIDRGIGLLQSAANADAEKGASTALTMLPVISAVPFVRGMSEQIKE